MSRSPLSILFVFIIPLIDSTAILEKLMFSQDPRGQPWVEVNLAPPRNPYPSLMSFDAQLEKRRDELLSNQTRNLTLAYLNERASARQKIDNCIKSNLELFDDPSVVQSLQPVASFMYVGEFRVEVGPHNPVLLPGVADSVEALETYRESKSNGSYEWASQLLKDVTLAVVQSLNDSMRNDLRPIWKLKKSALIQMQAVSEVNARCRGLKKEFGDHFNCTARRHPGFGETPHSPHESASFMQLPPNGGVATVGKILEDLQTRRNIAEDLFTQRALAIAVRLATDELKYLEENLAKAVGGILKEYQSAVKVIMERFGQE